MKNLLAIAREEFSQSASTVAYMITVAMCNEYTEKEKKRCIQSKLCVSEHQWDAENLHYKCLYQKWSCGIEEPFER